MNVERMTDTTTPTLVQLSAATLSALSPAVHVPSSDRAGLTAGIVHFGVGGFHRAHQALMIDDLLEQGGPVALSAAIVASWARYAEGTDEQGEPIDVVDRIKDAVMQSAAGYATDPHSFLRDRNLFGDLIGDAAFVAAYDRALDLLHTGGARGTLEQLMESN